MEDPAVEGVDDALDELVNQFSDPLSFLRELVQNAIDAGSHEVEITTAYEPKNGGDGVAVISLCDWGGGMTREIIETKLTRLFSSNKDGDRTKIGKFGIGFVSVFAIEPAVVCVDTARDGEAWRVLFDANRTFRLVRLDEPIEGTRVRVYKPMPQADFEAFSQDVRRTVQYWCKHAKCDIHVDGESIAVPFGFEDPCSVDCDDGYSRVAVCHPLDRSTFLGLYNGGLTLVERSHGPFEELAVRAWSPHLEHTLTRDAVIEDEGYARVLGAIEETVGGPLCLRAFERLHEEMLRPVPSPLRDHHLRCAAWHLRRGLSRKARLAVAPRAVAQRASGGPVSLDALLGGVPGEEVLLTRTPGPLSDAAEAAGHWVLRGAAGSADGQLLELIAGLRFFEVRELEASWALALPLRDDAEHEQFDALGRAAQWVFCEAGHKVSQVLFGHFDYPGSNLGGEVAISQREPFTLTPCSDVKTIGRGFFSRSRPVVANADHRATRALAALATRDLSLASYMLTKLFFVGHDLTPAIDGALADAATRLEMDA